MAADGSLHVVQSAVWIVVQQRRAAHHHSGCAKAALQGVMLDEGLLNRMQLAIASQAFYRRDASFAHVKGEGHAARGDLAVHQYGTGRASSPVASDFRAGQPQLLPEKIGERSCRIDVYRYGPAI